MLMNIAAFVCFAIVVGVMIGMKVYFDRSEKLSASTEKEKK